YLVALSPDGKSLASALRKTITLWDVASGKQTGSFDAGSGHLGLRFLPGGELLAWRNAISEVDDGRITVRGEYKVWFPAEPKRAPYGGTVQAHLGGLPTSFNGIAARPDGGKLLLLLGRQW